MKIYNTLTRQKEEFIPVNEGKVKMYSCGPTVYNYFHIGNARPFLFFDVVRRYFEFLDYKVTYVQNITDVDDKLIDQSKKEKKPVEEIAQHYIQAFYEDLEALEIRKVDIQPKATEHIQDMIQLIMKLEDKGIAYEINGDVYFSVDSFPKYGNLARKKVDDLLAGVRIEKNNQKKHSADFTLWKAAKPGEPKWDSPWGEGRPGWHSECVVMSQKYLGETFDIHGGGTDLIFPHHENEIAQAEAAYDKPFVKYWMHNGYLNIEGEKMSKSLNNFFTARDILKKYSAEAIRFFFLSKHYRSPIDFKESIIKESEVAVKGFYQALRSLNYQEISDEKLEVNDEIKDIIDSFKTAMNDDFNTAKALAVLFDVTKKINQDKLEIKSRQQYAHLLVKLGKILGFFHNLKGKLSSNIDNLAEDLVNLLIQYRDNSKKEKNWNFADQIRKDLHSLGICLKDTKDGTKWELE